MDGKELYLKAKDLSKEAKEKQLDIGSDGKGFIIAVADDQKLDTLCMIGDPRILMSLAIMMEQTIYEDIESFNTSQIS